MSHLGYFPYANSYRNRPSGPIDTRTAPIGFSSAIRARNSADISGSSVRVRMWSTLRAPLATSVHRLATPATSSGS